MVNPRPPDKNLLITLLGYDNDINDVKQPEVAIGQPDMTMHTKTRKLFNEIQDDMTLRKHLPRHLGIKYSRILQKESIHDLDRPISVKEFSAEYGNSHSLKISTSTLQKTCSFTNKGRQF